jgi:hypothetical protein
VADAIDRASAAVRGCDVEADPLFPMAILRGHALVGRATDADALLVSWEPWSTRLTGAVRYRWAIDPRFSAPLPAWAGEESTWVAWRPREVAARPDRPDGLRTLVDRLLTPIILADALELLGEAEARTDATGVLARAYLDEALPKIRRDAAAWVDETHAWSDTWALWAIARRPGALRRLHPFALVIADAYAATARRTGNVVLGTRCRWEPSAVTSPPRSPDADGRPPRTRRARAAQATALDQSVIR